MTSPVGAQGDGGQMEDETLTATPWHCTTDGVTWPGCGRCGPCRDALPALTAWARDTRARLAAVGKACTRAERDCRPGTVAALMPTVFVRDVRAALGATDQAGGGR